MSPVPSTLVFLSVFALIPLARTQQPAAPGALLPLGTQSREAPAAIAAVAETADGDLWIAGDFWTVNGQPRAGLAKLRADGQVTGFAPEVGIIGLGGLYFLSTFSVSEPQLHPLPDGGLLATTPGTSVPGQWVVFDAAGKEIPWPWPGVPAGTNTATRFLFNDSTHLYFAESKPTSPSAFAFKLGRITFATGQVDESFAPPIEGPVLAVQPAGNGRLWVLENTTPAPLMNSDGFTPVTRATIRRLLANGSADQTWTPRSVLTLGGSQFLTDGPANPWWLTVGPINWNYWPTPSSTLFEITAFPEQGEATPLFQTSVPTFASLAVARRGDFFWANVENWSRLRRYTSDGKVDPAFPELPLTGPKLDVLANGDLLLDGARRHRPDGTAVPGWSIPKLLRPAGVSRIVAAAGHLWVEGQWKEWNGVPMGPLQRLNADGALDQSFAWQPPAGSWLHAWAVAPDGKVYVLCSSSDGRSLSRLNPDGSPDPSFTPLLQEAIIQGGSISIVMSGGYADVEVLTDGSVLVRYDESPDFGLYHSWWSKVLPGGGGLDPSFLLTQNDFSSYTALFPLRSGSFWLNGRRHRPDGTTQIDLNPGNARSSELRIHDEWPNGQLLASTAEGLRRLHADGQVDATFRPQPPALSAFEARALPDGQALLSAWETAAADGSVRHRLLRLRRDGSIDPTFRAPALLNRQVAPGVAEFLGFGGRFNADAYRAGGYLFPPTPIGRNQRLLAAGDGHLWIAGNFTHVGGERRDGLAALALATPTGYAGWAAAIWADEPDGPAAFADDADGDGMSNGVEYVLGTDPRQAEFPAPGLAIETTAPLVLSAPRNYDVLDATVFLEVSEDGQTWRRATSLEVSPLPSATSLRYQINTFAHWSFPPTTRLFRLSVSLVK